jgi:hypothetical protein
LLAATPRAAGNDQDLNQDQDQDQDQWPLPNGRAFRLRRVTWKNTPSNQGCLLLVRPLLRRGSLTPTTLSEPAPNGHPCPDGALAASMRLDPLRVACARPAPKSRFAVSGGVGVRRSRSRSGATATATAKAMAMAMAMATGMAVATATATATAKGPGMAVATATATATVNFWLMRGL